jgi:hypothetical protein
MALRTPKNLLRPDTISAHVVENPLDKEQSVRYQDAMVDYAQDLSKTASVVLSLSTGALALLLNFIRAGVLYPAHTWRERLFEIFFRRDFFLTSVYFGVVVLLSTGETPANGGH